MKTAISVSVRTQLLAAVLAAGGLVLTEIAAVVAGHIAGWRMQPTWILQAVLLGMFGAGLHVSMVARRGKLPQPAHAE